VASIPTERVRNVLVVGHTGAGSSTVVEGLLADATGRLAHGEGCPTVDHEPEERARGHSLSLAAVACELDGVQLNLLDAPGGVEVAGDLYPALPAADTVVLVVDATVGLQPQHEAVWRLCEERDVPRVVFLNKLDLERARYQACVDELRERYGKPVAPVHMPLGIHDAFDGVIDLLHGIAVEEHDGQRVEREIPASRRDQAGRNRESLVEAVVENDDDLLERYLEGEEPSVQQLAELFAHGVAECGFFPVLCGSAAKDIGIDLLAHFLVEETPSPAEAPHPVPHDAPTTLYVAKTFTDQYVGRINLLRVLSGELAADDVLTVRRTGADQRLHQLFRLRGREQLPVDRVAAGDLVAVAKLDDVRTGDVLVADGVEVDLDVPEAPEGLHRVVVEAAALADDDKLSIALHRIVEEDPAVEVHVDGATGKRVVAFQGPVHAEVTVARLARKHGVEVVLAPAPVAYRETIRATSTGVGKHVKQTGGHGQFGIAHIELAPLERGEGFRFTDRTVGGVIPGSLVPSVEKGVREAMGAGPIGGHPVVDVAVTLMDGKHHPVDSSDAAFRMAGILAFRDAIAGASPVLLEPVAEVQVVVPDELTGTVMSDLSGRRGRILGADAAGAGRTRVQAHVPEAELATIASDLRAVTSGRASVTVAYDHHDEVPDDVARRLTAPPD
jgi:elongation factor G